MRAAQRRAEPVPWAGTEVLATGSPRGTVPRRGKRLLDILVAATALVLASPLLLAIAVAVKASGPGGVFFRQTRVGYLGRDFTMLKFRTMHVGASEASHREYVTKLLVDEVPDAGSGRLYKLCADPRVTRIGHLLRRFSLDELPQLINVLRGDMSLVGPRPALHYEVSLFESRHRVRFLVPPGITGLWQVSGRSRLTMREALDLDVEYVHRQCMRLDLLILVKTLPAVLRAEDAA